MFEADEVQSKTYAKHSGPMITTQRHDIDHLHPTDNVVIPDHSIGAPSSTQCHWPHENRTHTTPCAPNASVDLQLRALDDAGVRPGLGSQHADERRHHHVVADHQQTRKSPRLAVDRALTPRRISVPETAVIEVQCRRTHS